MLCCVSDFLVASATLVALVFVYLKWKSTYWQRLGIKSLPSHIIFGNVQNPFNQTKSGGFQFEDIYHEAKKQNLECVGTYALFQAPGFMPINLSFVKSIMSKDFASFTDRGTFYNEVDDPLSAHLFALGGPKWRNLRVKMTPTFTAGKMKQMFHTVAECGVLLEKILNEKRQNADGVDIKEVLGCYSTDIICSCAFGLEVHASTDPNSEFRKHGREIFKFTSLGFFKRQFANNFTDLARSLRMKLIPKDLTNFFMNVVQETMNYRKTNNTVRNDFLQLMIEMQNKDPSLTLEIIAAQCFVFFVAGFETSSTTMTFALYELACRQDLQDKVRDEINTVLKQHDGQITYDSMMDLKYMGQVIDETLRKWPAVPVITRKCVKDYTFPDTNISVKEGTRILISTLGIQHDAEHWPEPYKFDPDRFSEENKQNIPDFAHIPFGEGPRLCIGMRFGVMQTKVGLTSVLRNYKVTLNQKTVNPLKMDIRSGIPSIEGGLWLNLEKL